MKKYVPPPSRGPKCSIKLSFKLLAYSLIPSSIISLLLVFCSVMIFVIDLTNSSIVSLLKVCFSLLSEKMFVEFLLRAFYSSESSLSPCVPSISWLLSRYFMRTRFLRELVSGTTSSIESQIISLLHLTFE